MRTPRETKSDRQRCLIDMYVLPAVGCPRQCEVTRATCDDASARLCFMM